MPRLPWTRNQQESPNSGPDSPSGQESAAGARPAAVPRPPTTATPPPAHNRLRPPAGQLEPIDPPFTIKAPLSPAPPPAEVTPRRPPPPPAETIPRRPSPAALATEPDILADSGQTAEVIRSAQTPQRPVPQPVRIPEITRVYARFGSAWAALTFAGQLPGGHPITELTCLRGGPSDAWWIEARLTIGAAREMISIGSGELFLPTGNVLVRDRGWGNPASQDGGEPVPVGELRAMHILDLLRVAGVHAGLARPLVEVVLLLPGVLVGGVIRRAMDLGLSVGYRPVELGPLFSADTADQASYEVTVRATVGAQVPASLVTALDRDPFILVCRRAADTVLIRHQATAPLSDRTLGALSSADERGGIWVLADESFGCSVMHPIADEYQDGTSLVRRGDQHELADASGDSLWADPAGALTEPRPPILTLAPTRMSGMPVDATLLDDAELACLPALLAGEPLAESALLVRGRDRHLLTAPGGLLEQLPLGEPLYCLGPGSLYLPLGYRLTPGLPPQARAELFPARDSSAIIVLPRTALRFNLAICAPVWTLWIGELPTIDDQIPNAVAADLHGLDAQTTSIHPNEATQAVATKAEPAARASTPVPLATPTSSGTRQSGPFQRSEPSRRVRTWRDEAYEAELAGDLVWAGDLHAQHNDPLRAARLYERAAERS